MLTQNLTWDEAIKAPKMNAVICSVACYRTQKTWRW